MQVPGYILKHTTIKDEKTWHFYLLLALWASAYTTMNLSIIILLNEILQSIFLAGLALSIGSFFSLIFDSIFNRLQKTFEARTLFLTSVIGMMLSVGLFFIPMHVTFAYIAAIFFRISFDLCDITALSYIFSKSLPAEYGEQLSYKQFSQGTGMLLGFVISAILVQASNIIGYAVEQTGELISLTPQFDTSLLIMKVFIFVILFVLLILAYILFDRNVKNLDKETIRLSWQKLQAETIDELQSAKATIMKNQNKQEDIPKNQVEIINRNQEKTPIQTGSIFAEMFESILHLYQVIQKKPRNIPLLWSLATTGIFSYWDTFLMTFLPIYFTEVLRNQEGFISNLPGSLLLLAFILPVLIFLPKVAKLADNYGRPVFTIAGISCTVIATLALGIFGSSDQLIFIILAGYGISVGYLFGMSSAKAEAASKLNEFFAVENKSGSIDSNISAGPLMLIDNIGNIIGPTLGGFLVDFIGFNGFFILFSLGLSALLVWTLKHIHSIKTPNYVFAS